MLNTPLWKKIFVLLICLTGIYLALPNFVNTKNWPIYGENQNKVNLGLDLQGGVHLLLDVDLAEYMTAQYRSQSKYVRTTLREAKIGYKGLKFDANGVSFNLRDSADADQAQKLLLDSEPTWEVEVVDGKVDVVFKDQFLNQKRSELLDQSIEIIRRRVDESGTKEPLIQRQGDQRIVLQVAGEEDPEAIKSRINTAAKLTFHMVVGEDATATTVPALGNIILKDNENVYYEVEEEPLLGGENLENATQTFDSFGNVAVAFKFDTIGGRIFGDVTKSSVGKRFASVLDGVVVSAPVIREPILGGNGQITGNFDVVEATELATLLRAGALPASLRILEERTVGASLGADSIAKGETASLIAIGIVSVFMFFAYGGVFGAISVFALTINVILIIACLSLFQATLTLPGIAGIVLIVGMAVDANVLIYERIKEEIAGGKKLVNAIYDGFDRAWATIFDSNVTTLIMGLLLFTMGSGPVRGFAVTLSIGILCTMFSAVVVCRILVFEYYQRKRPKTLSIAYKK